MATALRRLRGAEADLARADRVPDLELGGGVRSYSGEEEWAWVAEAAIPLPLFDRGRGRNGEADARVAAAAECVDAEAATIAKVGLSVASTTVDQVQGIKRASGSMAAINGKVSGIAHSAQLLSENVEEASSSTLELGAAGEELNQTASSLTAQITEVGSSIEEMIRSARQVSENTDALAGAVSETSASMSQMADSMQQVERDLIAQALRTAGGNQTKAARLLGMSRDTLRYRIKKHGLSS